MNVLSTKVEAYMKAGGWTTVHCLCHFECFGYCTHDLFVKTAAIANDTEKLNTLDLVITARV